MFLYFICIFPLVSFAVFYVVFNTLCAYIPYTSVKYSSAPQTRIFFQRRKFFSYVMWASSFDYCTYFQNRFLGRTRNKEMHMILHHFMRKWNSLYWKYRVSFSLNFVLEFPFSLALCYVVLYCFKAYVSDASEEFSFAPYHRYFGQEFESSS